MKGCPEPWAGGRRGSTFVIVLWVAFGLVSLALYFAEAMTLELRSADSRVAGIAAEQAIDGAVRYLHYALTYEQTNGVVPDPATYLREAVAVGDARFWFIGRDTNDLATPLQVSFGLVDEGRKLNLNSASSNMLVWLPGMNLELTAAILDWRNTNGGTGSYDTYYGMHNPPYQNKSAPFETVEELKLVYGADMETLLGEDLNLNGFLDPNEADENRNNSVDPGVLEYLTVYSREPNTYSNGIARVNIRSVSQTGQLPSLLQTALGTARANAILTALGLATPGGPPGGGSVTLRFASPLEFFLRCRANASMTAEEFDQIAEALTVVAGEFIEGRVNVNTASEAVLSCLPGISDSPDLARTLINYRVQNPTRLNSIAWVAEALGQDNTTALAALAARDCLTTRSFQYSADIAALGPHGRGYRRVRFIIDTMDGAPRVIFRQDLTHLGWALGKEARQTWLYAKDSR